MSFLNNEQWFVLEECPCCGCTFAITSRFQTQRKQDKREFFCPNGHAQSYIKSTADILREQLDQEKAKHAATHDKFYWAEQRAIKAEKELESLTKKKAKAGGITTNNTTSL